MGIYSIKIINGNIIKGGQRFFDSQQTIEAVPQRCSVKKMFLQIPQNSQGNVFFNKRLWHSEFFSEFCEISKNTFSYRTRPVAASKTKVILGIMTNLQKYIRSLPVTTRS